MSQPRPTEDPNQALRGATNSGLIAELWHLLRTSRKWWLLPILAAFLVLGVLIVLANTAAAPFIYTLF